ncbi:MAG: hypothetical protein CL389_00015 [Acidiferrobacteraceae bacterium]|nr:hypothetical protein [Acidiferrobacteraceae bacterium]
MRCACVSSPMVSLTVLFVVLLFSWPGTAAAQSDELMRTYRQGATLEKAGRYSEAIPFYLKALRMGEREFGPDDPNIAMLLNKLALSSSSGLYKDHEPPHMKLP